MGAFRVGVLRRVLLVGSSAWALGEGRGLRFAKTPPPLWTVPATPSHAYWLRHPGKESIVHVSTGWRKTELKHEKMWET